jgi:asparagine synthase (glutamine-hydrolysing)
LHPGMIVHEGTTKFVLRKAMNGVLPPAIADRQDKIGFATPESTWFREGFQPFLNEIFESDTLRSRGIFDIPSIQAEWNGFKSGARTDPFIIWRVAAIELWFRRFMDAGNR